MDIMLLRAFQRQVLFQCQAILTADEEIRRGLAEGDLTRVFCGVQNMLNAATNCSKALWGQSGRFATQRQELRDSIGVADNSPLRDPDMRNNFEHFDERLDRWWLDSTSHNYADMNLMPRNAIQGLDDIDMFRAFDPATWDLGFWGQTFNLRRIVIEVQRILPKVSEDAQKPHWEMP